MPLSSFVHLHVHTAYSLAEGAVHIDELAKKCHETSMPAVAMMDTANLFGALEFSSYIMKNGIQPIMGCLLNVQDENGILDPLPLYAQSETGYRNLLKLTSYAYLNSVHSHSPAVSYDFLFQHNEGIICLTGGAGGALGRLLSLGKKEEAVEFAQKLRGNFQDRVYIEITRHGTEKENLIEEDLLNIAYHHQMPIVATNHVYFLDPDMYEAHDALLCIAQGNYVVQEDRRKSNPEYYFKSPEEMTALFADLPEAIANTLVIAKRCAYSAESRKPILPNFPTQLGRSEEEELRDLAEKGLEMRLENYVFKPEMGDEEKERVRQDYKERLYYELNVIINMGFSGYFLIVADFISWAKAQNIPVGPGRGSGAGSLVAWSLTITDMDPIHFELIFERFLNPERVSMPDFDIDFCQDRRDEVIEYVISRYGRDRVAQIITFGKLQTRAVLRDVGRVLQVPYPVVDRICKLIPNNPASPVTLGEVLETEPQIRAEIERDENLSYMFELAQKLEGLYRHASTHAAGIVIGDRPLNELVPLYRDPESDLPVTQFSMKYVEMAGLVKFDFLGLKTLTILQKTVDLLKLQDIHVDIGKIPLDDPKTFDLLCRIETVGVFQLESAGMRDVLFKLMPDRFEDIIALVALYRPGPMDDIPRYIACKHGLEKVTYPHPALEEILKPTFGVMVYQEQVMQIAQVLAGYTLGGADLLRRAMGKKIKSEMADQRLRFIEGAIKNGAKPKDMERLFDQIAKFASYAFNKSHSAPYGLLAYQTAYFKANYPVEFLAANMCLDLHHTEKLAHFAAEVHRMKISLLPPDVNASEVLFTVENGGVRYGLAGIKGIGIAVMEILVNERKAKGPFKNMVDFIKRLDTRLINKRTLEALIQAGALDSLHGNRQELFCHIEDMIAQCHEVQHQKQSNQSLLFQKMSEPVLKITPRAEWDTFEKLSREHQVIGFYLSSHPLKHMTIDGVSSIQDLLNLSKDQELRVLGMIHKFTRKVSKNGHVFGFVEISDSFGGIEATIFADNLAKYKEYLQEGVPCVVGVHARHDGESVRYIVTNVIDLESYMKTSCRTYYFYIKSKEDLECIIHATQKDSASKNLLILEIDLPSGQKAIIKDSSGIFIKPFCVRTLIEKDVLKWIKNTNK